MVNVEIDDSCAANTVTVLRVARGDGRVVEQTKSHRTGGFGVVGHGRPRGDEGVGCYLANTSSTASTAPPTARSAASKLPGDIRGVGVETHHPFAGRCVPDLRHVVHGVT